MHGEFHVSWSQDVRSYLADFADDNHISGGICHLSDSLLEPSSDVERTTFAKRALFYSRMLLERNQRRDAVRLLRLAIRADATFWPAHVELNLTLAESGHMDEARDAAANAIVEAGFWADPWQRPAAFLPMLDSRPFWVAKQGSDLFSWLPGLEACSSAIQAELMTLLPQTKTTSLDATRKAAWAPVGVGTRKSWLPEYEVLAAGEWKELVLFGFEEDAEAMMTARAIAPYTVAAVERLLPEAVEMAACGAGEVTFSALWPGTRVRPHCARSNIRLTAHLGLLIPSRNSNDCSERSCGIRVGTEHRQWQHGQVLIFDDSFEHEVWNDTASVRVVLLIRFWHPSLRTKVQRENALRCVREDLASFQNSQMPPFGSEIPGATCRHFNVVPTRIELSCHSIGRVAEPGRTHINFSPLHDMPISEIGNFSDHRDTDEDLWKELVRPFLNDKVEVARILAVGGRVQREYADLLVESTCFDERDHGMISEDFSCPAELRKLAALWVCGSSDGTLGRSKFGQGLIVKPADSSLCRGVSVVLRTSGQEADCATWVPLDFNTKAGPHFRHDRIVVGTLDEVFQRGIIHAMKEYKGGTKSKRVLVSRRVQYAPPTADSRSPDLHLSIAPELRIIFHRGSPLYASLTPLSDPDLIVWRRDFAQNNERVRGELSEKIGFVPELHSFQSVDAIHDQVWQRLGLMGGDSQTQKHRAKFHDLVQRLCAIPAPVKGAAEDSHMVSGSAIGFAEALLADWNDAQEPKRRLLKKTGEPANLSFIRGRMDFLLERDRGGEMSARLSELQTYSGTFHPKVCRKLLSFLLKG